MKDLSLPWKMIYWAPILIIGLLLFVFQNFIGSQDQTSSSSSSACTTCIDFSGANVSVTEAGTLNNGAANGSLTTAARSSDPYCLAFKGDFDTYKEGLISPTARGNYPILTLPSGEARASLFFGFTATTPNMCQSYSKGEKEYGDCWVDPNNDKAMLQLNGDDCKSFYGAKNSTGQQAFGETRYTGIAYYVGSDFTDYNGGTEAPPNSSDNHNVLYWDMIFQIWQGAPYGPPLAAVFKGGEQQKLLHFFYRNDQLGYGPHGFGEVPGSPISVPRDRWFYLVVGATPQWAKPDGEEVHGSGSLQVWVFSADAAGRLQIPSPLPEPNLQVDSLIFGYDPNVEDPDSPGKYPNHTMQTMFGLYRSKQAAAQRIYFGLAKQGATLQDVLPK